MARVRTHTRISKAALQALNDQYHEVVKTNVALTEKARQLQEAVDTATDKVGNAYRTNDGLRAQLQKLHNHITVLQGDRDRLTAIVESLARRLASPSADYDPNRGGWRGAAYTDGVNNNAKSDPTPPPIRITGDGDGKPYRAAR